jgi:hypothetical protein
VNSRFHPNEAAKMKMRFALALIGLLLVSKASLGQTLYPVHGPQSGLTPPAVFEVKLTGALGGNFSVVLANGETFQGNWTTVTANSISARMPQGTVPSLPEPDLASAWDAIFGQGYYVASVLGERVGRVVATGSKGTVLQLEFINGRFGVGVDSNGNLYKMAWMAW